MEKSIDLNVVVTSEEKYLCYVFFIQVPMEDLQSASKLLSKAMKIRERYMKMSQQRFPTLAESYLRGAKGFPEEGPNQPNKATIEGKYDFRNKKVQEKNFFS